ncbi:hypothetical protein JCM11641_000008 [Rhodosporidiobolus odoratus]
MSTAPRPVSSATPSVLLPPPSPTSPSNNDKENTDPAPLPPPPPLISPLKRRRAFLDPDEALPEELANMHVLEPDEIVPNDSEVEFAPSVTGALSAEAEGITTRENFDKEVEGYLGGLSAPKRAKALMTSSLHSLVLSILLNPKDTSNGTAQFRFWAKQRFHLLSTPEGDLLAHDGKPVAMKENLYDVLAAAHLKSRHGGRDKTFLLIKDVYSCVPKELVSAFVKKCSHCNTSKSHLRHANTAKRLKIDDTPADTPPVAPAAVD